MMETKHAPTPWRINGHDICSGPYAVAGVYGTTGADARTSEANAAFIVRACNAHEALVEALNAAAIAMRMQQAVEKQRGVRDADAWGALIRHACEALTKAIGE